MVHVSAIGRCTLNRISTCIFYCRVQDQIMQMNFQTESYFFFPNNFKFFVLDKLISYFHIVYILGNILFIGVIIFNNINLFYLFTLIILF